jgi:hypothetical protein
VSFEDDEENPWRWIGTAKEGQPSEVIVGERLGLMHIHTPVALIGGNWYVIDPPGPLRARPVAWRYAMEPVDNPSTQP